MKKLCAVLLFVFVASLFVAGAAFATALKSGGVDAGFRVDAAQIAGIPDRVQVVKWANQTLSDSWGGWIVSGPFYDGRNPSAGTNPIVELSADVSTLDVAYMDSADADNLMGGVIPSTLKGAAGARDRYVRQMNSVWLAKISADKDLAIVAFPLAPEFHGKKASEIFAVKAITASKKEAFTMVYNASELVNKTSAIEKRKVGSTTVLLGADDIVGADDGATYYVVMVVEDNLDQANGFDIMQSFDYVGDPSFVIASNPLVRHAPDIFGRPTGTAFKQAVVGRNYVAAGLPLVNTVQLHRAVAGYNSNSFPRVTDRKNTGFRYLKPSIIADFGLTDATKVQELPAYNVMMDSANALIATGDVTVVLFYLDPKFEGLKASDVKVATARVDAFNQVIRKDFTQVYAPLDLADGTSAVLKQDGDHQVVLGKDDVIGAGYYLAICVKDDSAFDLADDNAHVLVAPVVYTAGGVTPKDPELVVTPASPSIKVGETQKLTAKVENSDKSFGFTWSSGDEKVAKVDKDGLVLAVAAGTAKIKCVADELATTAGVPAAEQYTKEVTVTVTQATSSSSSGGCSVGGFAPATLLLLAPLFLLLKK